MAAEQIIVRIHPIGSVVHVQVEQIRWLHGGRVPEQISAEWVSDPGNLGLVLNVEQLRSDLVDFLASYRQMQ